MARFTELTADICALDKNLIRGRCVQLDPEDWGIGGQSAAELRRAEIEARQHSAGQ
jgi:4-oxalocrotonate tautomerase